MTKTAPLCSSHRPALDPRLLGRKAWDGSGTDLLMKAAHGVLELKADEATPGRISGYGSKFGLVDSYGETVVAGAFAKSLKAWKRSKRPVPMLWQHSSNQPIGVWDEFEEDDVGLKLSGMLNLETQRGKEAYSDVRMQSVGGLSIGYYEIKADPWDWDSTDPRKLIELDLREVSVVTFPALREANIDAVKARLLRGERPTIREFESFLREKLNVSRSDAEDIASAGYKAWLQRDVAPGAKGLQGALAEMRAAVQPLVLPSF